MKKILAIALSFMLVGFITSCKKTETSEKAETTVDAEGDSTPEGIVPDVVRKSAVSVDTLTAILIRSIKNKDKSLYISYCFTQKQEDSLASLIVDKKKKKLFQREFGFSLHEEVIYFENIISYIDKNAIDLSKIEPSIIEVFDYNKSSYAEVSLKEIVIPIIQAGFERDIVYVAIQIDGRWYFTSELGL